MGAFKFVRNIASRIAGVDTIKSGSKMVQKMGAAALGKNCPLCNEGRLIKKSIEIDEATTELSVCAECGYQQLLDGPSESELGMLREQLDERLDKLPSAEVAQLKRQFRLAFRVYLTVSMFSFIYAFMVMVYFKSVMILIPASGFSALFFALAIKSSYRHWQLETHTFFQPGSFKSWWNSGNWFI